MESELRFKTNADGGWIVPADTEFGAKDMGLLIVPAWTEFQGYVRFYCPVRFEGYTVFRGSTWIDAPVNFERGGRFDAYTRIKSGVRFGGRPWFKDDVWIDNYAQLMSGALFRKSVRFNGDMWSKGETCFKGSVGFKGRAWLGGKTTLLGLVVHKWLAATNIDGSDSQLIIVLGKCGTVKVQADGFTGTADEFCERAMGEGKLTYAAVVSAIAAALKGARDE